MNKPRLKAFRWRAWLLLALSATALLATAGPAPAANGDLLRQITADMSGNACATGGIGVGLAFDGTNLLVSCYFDSTVTAVSPADGHQIAVHSIAGAGALGALAWDNSRGTLWGCSNFNDVGTIDLTTNTFTFKFSSPGCFDGLAYDGSDDTLWTSPDATNQVTHSTAAGAALGTFYPSIPCGNSGIAVGGPLLYLANDGCSSIYTTDKAFSTAPSFFASFPARLEDMECDNLSFAPLGAMWSKDAYDNTLNAWEIPAGSCSFGGGGGEPPPAVEGFMTGGGSVFTSAGMRVTHGFELNCDAAKGPNNLQVNWGKGNRFHLTGLTSAACSDDASISEDMPAAGFDTYTGKGTGDYNGIPGATAEWTFTDAGEPGTADSVSLTIKDAGGATVLSVTGTLRNGNQQAHAS